MYCVFFKRKIECHVYFMSVNLHFIGLQAKWHHVYFEWPLIFHTFIWLFKFISLLFETFSGGLLSLAMDKWHLISENDTGDKKFRLIGKVLKWQIKLFVGLFFTEFYEKRFCGDWCISRFSWRPFQHNRKCLKRFFWDYLRWCLIEVSFIKVL